MDQKTHEMFQIYSNRPTFHKLIEQTLNNINRHVSQGKCAVAFSGGKDSTVMLHLALQVDPNIDVAFWDQGKYLMPEEVTHEVISNAKTLGAKDLIVYSADVQQDERITESPFLWGVSHRWKYHIINKLKKEHGWKTQFIGLRTEESISRRTLCTKPRSGEVYPVDKWRWMDIWAYIVSRGLPYPHLYDVYGPVMGWDKARFVNFFTKRFENLGAPYMDGFFFPQYRHGGS